MPFPITSQVGTAGALGGDGTPQPPRLGRALEQIVTELNPKYYEQASRGRLFHAYGGDTGLAIATIGTSPKFVLANPTGSGKNVAIIAVSASLVSGTIVVGSLIHAVNTNLSAAAVTGTAITPVSGLAGSNFLPVAKPLSTATLPANPTGIRIFGQKNATAATGPDFANGIDYVDGMITLSPGACWSLYSVGSDTSPLWNLAITWMEMDP